MDHHEDAPGGRAHRDEQLPPFPPEAGWLELEPPTKSDDFVDRVTRALIADGSVQADPADAADRPLLGDDATSTAAALAAFSPPAPAADFVPRALDRVQRDRAERWRRLLLRYETPTPTPDFVNRTLLALRQPRPRRGRGAISAGAWGRLARRAPTWRGLLLAAAAAMVLLLSWPDRPAAALRQVLADAPTGAAYAQSPALLSHLLAEDLADAQASVDGDWLWNAAGGRR